MKILSIIITSTFLIYGIAFADISIKAGVDKTSLTTDEALTYKAVISSTEKNLPAPEIPGFEGFSIVSQVQSSNVSVSGAQLKTSISYVFILVPTQEGKFKIPPATIKIGNRTYAADSFEIEVKQGKRPPQAPPKKRNIPEKSFPDTGMPEITL
jgi:hypothetical protein